MDKKIKSEKQLAAKEGVKYIKDRQIVGLGTGSTAYFAIVEIGEMVKKGLRINAIPTSAQTAKQAESLNIPLVSIDDVDSIDITIDGTDEFDSNLNLIKGGGGALLKEKMVARITKKQIIITDSSKKVETLGAFKIPVEVLPFASDFACKRIEEFGGKVKIRRKKGEIFLTDEKNYIIDTDFGLIENPYAVSDKLNNIEGVICNGLFLDLADVVIMGKGRETVVFEK
ncbi:MAG: ribose-5-phosphate isomerase RpiA [Acidobacteriota bacterium]|nr:ribose-5-phosphate isomerase RpiA [Acidobacteriota bacterium]